ncbi:hypothetical protein GALL_470570 [mine drainage metagenome]|uniref:Uncharacterized protein n=1 Tax=mine drainage metagenome TaxID=410659 RepID=A0A1J5PIA0_9ZZZZ
MRLSRRALGRAGGDDLRELALTLPEGEQLGRRRGADPVERQDVGGSARGRLQCGEDVLGGDDRGGPGDVRGDVRVAVPVAADPRAQADERAHDRLRRPGGVALQPVVEASVDRREDVEERGVEHRHHAVDLVEHARLRRAQRRRAPQHVDLREQPALVLGERDAAARHAVALGDEVGDPPDRVGDRAPPRLGRVGGDDRTELEVLQPLEGGLVTDLLGELRDGRRERVVGGELVRCDRGLALAQHPDAVVLLREGREVEVAGERACDLLGAVLGEALDQLLGTLERIGAGLVVRPDRQLAQALDIREEVVAAGLAEHGAEQAAEQADVVAQQVRDLMARKTSADVLG